MKPLQKVIDIEKASKFYLKEAKKTRMTEDGKIALAVDVARRFKINENMFVKLIVKYNK